MRAGRWHCRYPRRAEGAQGHWLHWRGHGRARAIRPRSNRGLRAECQACASLVGRDRGSCRMTDLAPALAYLDATQAMLEKIRATQLEPIAAAAAICADSI